MIKLQNNADCCGCFSCQTACPQNCITMQKDKEGFFYPCLDESNCINCSLCESVCPILNNRVNTEAEKQAYAAYTKDEAIRCTSSSGGIFTELANYVIRHGGLVFGAGFDDNFNVVHMCVEKEEDVAFLRGSKYVQSEIGDTYKRAESSLQQGKLVLFSGTPCQVAGLRRFLRKAYDNLITQDIICHGVPSPLVWRQYLTYRETKINSEVVAINLRNKKYGWKNYAVNFSFKNGEEHFWKFHKDVFMRAFLADKCLRPSCYDCHFKDNNWESDFKLADFWGIEHILPEMDDDKGVSLVFVNSKRAEMIWNEIQPYITSVKVDGNKALTFNSAATRSAKRPEDRNEFLSDVTAQPFDVVMNKYCPKISLGSRIINKLRKLTARKNV